MQKLYKDEDNILKICDEEHNASHILLTIKEYEILTFAIDNLKRISKERSNSSRGIQPKKERSGYILLGYDTNKLRMEFNKKIFAYDTRRLLLESPYNIQIGYKDATKFILDDMAGLALEFGAFGCIEQNSIISSVVFESLFTPESEKVLLISGLEAQRNGVWAVRLYANFTPTIPADCIRHQNNYVR